MTNKKIIKYCLNTAYIDNNINIHPRTYVESLGCKVYTFEAQTIADCIFMIVDNLPEVLPTHIKEAPNYKFYNPRFQKIASTVLEHYNDKV